MDAKIRRARPDETGILTELSMESKRSNGYDEKFMAACREELTVTEEHLISSEYWIAESEAVCGYASLRSDPGNNSGAVDALFIAPNWQLKGVGRLLGRKLIERARAKGFLELHLEADPFAVPFYEAIGFKVVGEVPSGSIAGRKLPYMTISLEGDNLSGP